MKPETLSAWTDTVAFAIFVGYSLLGLVCTVALFLRWGPLYTAVVSRGGAAKEAPGKGVGAQPGSISLSKLQMFLWTFVIVFAWLYHLVKDPSVFPELPAQALVLMGLSGAAYLGAKQQGIRAATAKAKDGQPESRPV